MQTKAPRQGVPSTGIAAGAGLAGAAAVGGTGSLGSEARHHGTPSPAESFGSHMSPQQQQNVAQLKTDLTEIKQGSQVTPEQKQELQSSLTAMAEGATRPDPVLVEALATDLSDAMSDGNLSNTEKMKLASELQKVMNSANIPASEVEAAIADAQAVLQASGVDQQDVEKVVADMQAIADEAKNNAPAPGAGSAAQSPAGRAMRFSRR